MAAYDLTSKVGAFLDRHLILPMLEFLSEKKASAVVMCLRRIAILCATHVTWLEWKTVTFPSLSPPLPSPNPSPLPTPPSPNPSPLPIPSLLQVYEEKEMLEARLELLSKTNMVPD